MLAAEQPGRLENDERIFMNSILVESGTSADGVSDDQLLELQENLGLDLPVQYIDFLKEFNGGVPTKKVFHTTKRSFVLERFLSVVSDYKTNELGCYDIEVVWSQVEDRLNDKLIPIAALFGGDLLCIQIDVNNVSNQMVVWDHDLSDEGQPVVYNIAPDFDSFLGMLLDE